MKKMTLMKRLLFLLMLVSLVAALFPAAALAQEEGEEDAAAEVAEVGEAEAEGGLLTPLGINGGLLAVQVLNFALIAFVLTRVLWRPAVNMLDARSTEIQKGLEDAAAAARARQNAEEEAEKVLSEARAERQKMLEEARAQAEEVKKQIETDARQAAERIRTDAQADAVVARDAELAGLRDQVLNISTAVAGRILEEEIDQAKQSELISRFFSRVPQGAGELSGEVEIVSAMPLTDDERGRVESEISADSYSYTVDPAILGGLIVRSQDRVIDGSTRTSLNNLSERLR